MTLIEPRHRRPALVWLTTAVLLYAWLPESHAQATVDIEVAPRQVYVGGAVSVGIRISDSRSHEPPAFPELPDCEITPRGTSTFQSFTSDQTTGKLRRQESITYNFMLTPRKPGTLTIPGIPVHVNDQTQVTRPVQIEVRQPPRSQTPREADNTGSEDAADLLLAEITCAEKRLYVGQTAEFTLAIWIKAAEYGGRRIPSSEMVRMISGNFAPFDNQQFTIDQAYRRSLQGGESLYYIVRLPAVVFIRQTGALAFDDVVVGIDYPTRFQRDRFFGNVQITGSLPIRIRPTVNVPEVLPLPPENRPPDFNGIVGSYQITAYAIPTKVRVGDPITLHIDVTGFPVETLPPPELKSNAELAENFRFPDEPMTGTVSGRTKRFTHTIRAKNASVGWIPAIEFPYFDPARGEYVVDRTQRIPLLVEKVDELAAEDLTGISIQTPQTRVSSVELRDGLRGNVTAEEKLLAQAAPVSINQVLAAAVLPPLAFLGLLGLRELLSIRKNETLRRRRGALRVAENRLAAARERKLSSADFHAEVAAALRGYLADRCDQPPARFVGAAAVEFLKSRSVADDLVRQWSELQQRCEEAAYAGGAETDSALADAALTCLRKFEGVRL